MAIATYGFAGEIDSPLWARLMSLGEPQCVAASSDFSTTAVVGNRRVSVSAGTARFGGLTVTSDSAVSLDLPTPNAGRWTLIVLRSIWPLFDAFGQVIPASPGYSTLTVIWGDETSSATPARPPVSYPVGLLNSPGTRTGADMPLAWAWVNAATTAVSIWSLRLIRNGAPAISNGIPSAIGMGLPVGKSTAISMAAMGYANTEAEMNALSADIGSQIFLAARNKIFQQFSSGWKDPAIASSAAEATQIRPAPQQGDTIFRDDLGCQMHYYGYWNASSNKGGATPNGWYPAPGALASSAQAGTQNVPSGVSTDITALAAISGMATGGIGLTVSGTGVTCDFAGWYEVTAHARISTHSIGGRSVAILLAGAVHSTHDVDARATAATPVEYTKFVRVTAAGQKIGLRISQTSGATLTAGELRLDIKWIGPARG